MGGGQAAEALSARPAPPLELNTTSTTFEPSDGTYAVTALGPSQITSSPSSEGGEVQSCFATAIAAAWAARARRAPSSCFAAGWIEPISG